MIVEILMSLVSSGGSSGACCQNGYLGGCKGGQKGGHFVTVGKVIE